MPVQEPTISNIIPRYTIEEIVGYRDKALALYEEAYTAIEFADRVEVGPGPKEKEPAAPCQS